MKRKKKIDARKENTYHQLKESLFLLLEEKTLEEIKVIDICEKAGIHRSTFYYHFNDKLELLKECLKETVDELYKDVELKNQDNLYDYYDILIDTYLDHVEKHEQFYSKILNLKNKSISSFILYEIISEEIYDNLEEIELEGVKFTIPIKIISDLLSGGILKVTDGYLNNKEEYDRNKFSEDLKLLLYHPYIVDGGTEIF